MSCDTVQSCGKRVATLFRVATIVLRVATTMLRVTTTAIRRFKNYMGIAAIAWKLQKLSCNRGNRNTSIEHLAQQLVEHIVFAY